MKMSADENDPVNIRLYANRRSTLINWEDINRMERPSRVFGSHHHLSIPSVIPDNEVAFIPINENSEGDEEDTRIVLRRLRMGQRLSERIARQTRRYSDPPYLVRNNSGVSRSNGRIISRHVHFSSTNRALNYQPNDRSQTLEQELPEVLEQEIETENQYEESNHGQESMSSIPSPNNENSSDDMSINLSVSETHGTNMNEENTDYSYVSNEIPRIVPFMLSPLAISSLHTDSPSDTSDTPIISINNNVPSALLHDRDILPSLTEAQNEEHPQTYEDLNKQLTDLFKCPVCFEHITPPICQCLRGHLICNKCVLKCDNCPICKIDFDVKRNLYMEKVGRLVKFPCKNSLTGCKRQMFMSQKEIHEQECCYRHYHCFFTNCVWKGFHPEIHVHMTNDHSNYILSGSFQSLEISLSSKNQTCRWFLLAHSEYFEVITYVNLKFHVKIQVNCIGPAVKAKQFKYTIILDQKERNDMSQKLTYERLTLPYSEIYEISSNLNLKRDIFSLPIEVLQPYIKQKFRLPFVLKIDLASG